MRGRRGARSRTWIARRGGCCCSRPGCGSGCGRRGADLTGGGASVPPDTSRRRRVPMQVVLGPPPRREYGARGYVSDLAAPDAACMALRLCRHGADSLAARMRPVPQGYLHGGYVECRGGTGNARRRLFECAGGGGGGGVGGGRGGWGGGGPGG